MGHNYGRAPGNVTDKQNYGMLDIPGGLTLTAISGGAVDISDGTDGSDSQDTITVDGDDILGASVTWATSDIVFGRAIARQINSNAANHSYWATFDGTDHVRIWPQNGAASTTVAVSGTDTSYTPTYENMNVTQAFVAAVRAPSWNYGDDLLPDTKMYQIGFDFAYLGSSVNASTLASAKAVELIVYPEDQVVYFHMGAEGQIYCPSAVETVIDVKGAMEGDVNLFVQAAAATNLAYRLRVH